eukprot:6487796-Amphidinium_carterae.1
MEQIGQNSRLKQSVGVQPLFHSCGSVSLCQYQIRQVQMRSDQITILIQHQIRERSYRFREERIISDQMGSDKNTSDQIRSDQIVP